MEVAIFHTMACWALVVRSKGTSVDSRVSDSYRTGIRVSEPAHSSQLEKEETGQSGYLQGKEVTDSSNGKFNSRQNLLPIQVNTEARILLLGNTLNDVPAGGPHFRVRVRQRFLQKQAQQLLAK